MRLSTRTRYGMRALLELALGYGYGPLSLKTSARMTADLHHCRKAGYISQIFGTVGYCSKSRWTCK